MTTMNEKKQKYYPVLDLVRFIAALFIIAIHLFPEGSTTESVGLDTSIPILLGESFVYSLLRAAVPIFFVISSFLLFKKIENNLENKWRFVGQFCLRLLFLYLFWYIAALPITIREVTTYISQGDSYQLTRYIINTLWKGAPRGFWFLVSLSFSVLLTNLCNHKKTFLVLTIIAIGMYVYGCLNSAYFGLFTQNENPIAKAIFITGDYLELYCSHLQALLFVVLGRFFASHGTFKIKGNLFFILLTFLLMVGELFLTLYFKLFVFADAFFTLPLFVFFFMNLILSIQSENESFARIAKKLKKVGSFSYLFHIQFFYYLHWILDALGANIFRDNYALLIIPYFVCVFLSFGLQTLFEHLSQYRPLSFLKYSY